MTDDWDETLTQSNGFGESGFLTSFGSTSNSFNGGGGFEGSGRGGLGRGNNRGCFKCGEEGHMSRECPSAGGGGGRGGGSRKCYKCNEEGHMSRECPNGGSSGGGFGASDGFGSSDGGFGASSGFSSGFGDSSSSRGGRGGCRGGRGGSRSCYKCGQEGHMSRDCTEGGSSGGGDFGGSSGGGGFGGSSRGAGRGGGGSSRACHKCQEEGHMARDCPNQPAGGDNGCRKCHKGHFARDCPEAGGPDDLGPDGKPRAPIYVPVDVTDEELFALHGNPAGINFGLYEKINVQVSGDDPIAPKVNSFDEAGLGPLLLENIQRAKYTCPTPIQKCALPIIMNGRDLMGCAQTGSGKTAAYLLPMIKYIMTQQCPSHSMEDIAHPTALIVAPTRELVIQICEEGRKFAMGSMVRCRDAYGGAASFAQREKLMSGCHILVATPGRLKDFLGKGCVVFDELRFMVLDEADRMLDMGFLPIIQEFMEHSTMPTKTDRQTLMFSATFPQQIQMLARKFLNNHVYVVVGMIGSANSDVMQTVKPVEGSSKRDELIKDLEEILRENPNEKILVFIEQKRNADFTAAFLCESNLKTTSIHGDRFQSQREEAIRTFKNGTYNILVATSVAARGLDIRGIGYVINFDIPKEVDEYVHRIGRTGRVGNLGKAISYFDSSTDAPIAKNLMKMLSEANQAVPQWLKEQADRSGHEMTYEGQGQFANRDIRNGRGDGGYMQNLGATATADGEDEVW